MLLSCASKKEFTIITAPEGATVSINGVDMPGTTPFTTKVSQRTDLGIVVSKPGYEVTSAKVETRTNFWLGLLWMRNDPRAQYIKENSVTIPMRRIPTISEYRPAPLPAYGTPSDQMKHSRELRPLKESDVPALRAMPDFKM